jgi:predicted pyridoxine 5'-phosphate oxidase superfamily flavin-nucleotide-binding protein
MPSHPQRGPWHEGERAMQERLGMAERMAEVGPRLIRGHMPDQHREFFEQLPFVLVGSVDERGHAWASVLSGAPGFLRSGDPHTLSITADVTQVPGVALGREIGLLGIEPHTRRRNRMNGTITAVGPGEVTVAVEQSFGNCPKYIHPRELVASAEPPGAIERFERLDARARSLIAAADTLFVCSYVDIDGRRQVDVSHRGGPAGFVRLDTDGTLTIPDYVGNRFFNTLGNITLQPRVGLLFIDFESGDVLQIAGTAQIWNDGDARLASLPAAERAWTVQPRAGQRVSAGFRLRPS